MHAGDRHLHVVEPVVERRSSGPLATVHERAHGRRGPPCRPPRDRGRPATHRLDLGEAVGDEPGKSGSRSRNVTVAVTRRPGPRRRRWYICSADSERSTAIHCTSSCAARPRRAVDCASSGPARTSSTRLVMSARSRLPARGAGTRRPRRGSSCRRGCRRSAGTRRSPARGSGRGCGGRRPRCGGSATYRYRSLTACHASRGSTSRVVRRFSRAGHDRRHDAATGVSRSASRNATIDALVGARCSGRRTPRRCR